MAYDRNPGDDARGHRSHTETIILRQASRTGFCGSFPNYGPWAATSRLPFASFSGGVGLLFAYLMNEKEDVQYTNLKQYWLVY